MGQELMEGRYLQEMAQSYIIFVCACTSIGILPTLDYPAREWPL